MGVGGVVHASLRSGMYAGRSGRGMVYVFRSDRRRREPAAGAWIADYILALVFGIGFQYAAIRGMERTLGRGTALRRAAKADILSLTAWQAGMYGWMAVAIFGLNGGMPLPRTSFVFWFMMQIAMACGFLAALPVNVLLIKAGIKKGM